jgi:hypothetical protein
MAVAIILKPQQRLSFLERKTRKKERKGTNTDVSAAIPQEEVKRYETDERNSQEGHTWKLGLVIIAYAIVRVICTRDKLVNWVTLKAYTFFT